MTLRPVLSLAAGAVLAVAFSVAVAPVQARSLSEAYQPARCFTCASWPGTEAVVVQAPDGTRRVVALSDTYRPYTRFDIEALRAFTRMP